MIYADYPFYANEYFGTVIKEQDFPRLALRASQYIDYITQGKAEKVPDLEAVKMACCALAEQYQLIDTAQEMAQKSLAASGGGQEIQSQTVGGWSKSYRSGWDSAQALMQASVEAKTMLYRIAQQYLANTGLLYRGRRCL